MKVPVCEVSVQAGWEAAHWLPGVPEGHKCRRLHGHSYRAQVTVCGPVDPDSGMVIDFGDVKKSLRALAEALDHQTLNDELENPTVENLVVWLWGELVEGFGGALLEVRAWEGESNTAAYRGAVAERGE